MWPVIARGMPIYLWKNCKYFSSLWINRKIYCLYRVCHGMGFICQDKLCGTVFCVA